MWRPGIFPNISCSPRQRILRVHDLGTFTWIWLARNVARSRWNLRGRSTPCPSGTCSWTAAADATAAIIGPLSGDGDGSFVFRVSPVGGSFRIGQVSVQWDGGSASFTYGQAACQISLVASLTFNALGGSQRIGSSIFPACPFQVATNAGWITTETPPGDGIDIVAKAATNTTGQTRTGTVTVMADGQTYTVPVTQTGN